MQGSKEIDVSLTDSLECWWDDGGPSHEFRFGSLMGPLDIVQLKCVKWREVDYLAATIRKPKGIETVGCYLSSLKASKNHLRVAGVSRIDKK